MDVSKPEQSLHRVQELVNQGQEKSALLHLHEVIITRKHRGWTAQLEEMVLKHLYLSVQLRKDSFARDMLMAYRLLCQQVNVVSLDKCTHYLLDIAEKKVEVAQAQLEDTMKALDDEDERDGAFFGLDDRQEGSNAQIVVPWVRFLWQCYRLCMDVTRGNFKFEVIFHDVAKRAFAHCEKFKRRREFRIVANTVRDYFPEKPEGRRLELKNQLLESQDAYNHLIEVRFKQLNVAIALDLWNEAYRAIENIHFIITSYKKTPIPRLMVEYFDRLSKIFWMSEHSLFHAYASWRHYLLIQQTPKLRADLKEDMLRTLASKVVLATVCIPFWEARNLPRTKEEIFQTSQARDVNTKLTILLGFSVVPNRQLLMQELQTRGILAEAHPEISILSQIINRFDPLDICKKISPALDFLKGHPTLGMYIEKLQRVAAVRTIEQISQSYSCVSFDMLEKLIPFFRMHMIEDLLLLFAKSDTLPGRIVINHEKRSCTFFGAEVNCDSLSAQLGQVSRMLLPMVSVCTSTQQRRGKIQRKASVPNEFFTQLQKTIQQEREMITQRKLLIEQRRELKEKQEIEAEMEAERRREEEQQRMKENEMKRMAEEAKNREVQRDLELQRERDRQQADNLVQNLMKTNKSAAEKIISKGEPKDKGKLIEDARQVLIQEEALKGQRLLTEAKRAEFLERAIREEERTAVRAKIQADLEERRKQRTAEEVTQEESAAAEAEKQKWEAALTEKRRLARMEAAFDKWVATLP